MIYNKSSKENRELITTAEAAKMLGYTIGSFRVMVFNKRPFPAYKMSGNKVMYNKRDIDAYIDARRIDPITIDPV